MLRKILWSTLWIMVWICLFCYPSLTITYKDGELFTLNGWYRFVEGD